MSLLGLNYASSDEDDVDMATPPKPEANLTKKDAPIEAKLVDISTETATSLPHKPANEGSSTTTGGPAAGPAAGPSATPPPASPGPEEDGSGHLSPHTAARSRIRNLTLPSRPNFDIPGSPPGSPPQKSTAKFTQFLELKKKGRHFNKSMEDSTALRNPAHLQKLIQHAGIADQYASTLPERAAVPTKFPEFAYEEQLSTSQQKVAKAREERQARTQRQAVDFVSASGASSKNGTPSVRLPQQSGAERIMAGLDRERSGSAHSQNPSGKRKELEHRGGRDDYSRKKGRSRSRSPKRRRSRSRDYSRNDDRDRDRRDRKDDQRDVRRGYDQDSRRRNRWDQQ